MKKLLLFAVCILSLSAGAQVQVASDINKGQYGSQIEYLFEFKNQLFFSAVINEDKSNPIKKLWKSDGTESGTFQIDNIPTKDIYKSDNFLYYVTYNEIWKSDGSESGTTKIAEDIYKLKPLGTFNDFFYYLAVYNKEQEIGLHKTDGTTTTIIKTFAPDTYATNLNNNQNAVYKLDNTRFVVYIYTKIEGVEPYISDGTEGGTYFLKDVTNGSNYSSTSSFQKMNDKFVFTNKLNQVWITDTTEEGTTFIGYFGNTKSQVKPQPVVFNNKIYYGKDDELWESDGTQTGNTMLFKNKDDDGNIESIIHYNNNLVLFLTRGIHIFDGTTTTKIATPDITTNYNGFRIKGDSKIYFSANYKDEGFRIWTTDGTAANTISIEPFWPDGNTPSNFTYTKGGQLLFSLSTSSGDQYNMGELWISDGTKAGTKMLKNINKTGNISSNPKSQTVLNGKIYFSADDNIHGRELFVFDGTTTSLVKDINPGVHSSKPFGLYVVNNKIIFKAYTLDKGYELWITDGTEAGTHIIKDINPNKGNAFRYDEGAYEIIDEFTLHNNELYFYANNGVNGYEPWKTDGTEAGTKMIKDINSGSFSSTNYDLGNRPKFVPYNNELYFFASKSGPDYKLSNPEIWKTDGTTSGTKLVTVVNTLAKEGSFYTGNLFTLNNYLYYNAEGKYTRKRNLFKTDGTTAGTKIVAELKNNTEAHPLIDKIYYRFSGPEGAGEEVWSVDKDDNNALVQDIVEGSTGSLPSKFYRHKDYLYFAININYKTELWRLSDTTAPEKVFSEENDNGDFSLQNYFDYVSVDDRLLINTEQYINSQFYYKMYQFNNTSTTATPVFSLAANNYYNSQAGGFRTISAFYNNKLYFTTLFEGIGKELGIVDLGTLSIEDYVDETKNNFTLTLFPNPTSNQLEIKTKSTIKSVLIYDILGKKVGVYVDKIIDVRNYKKGIYILKVEDQFGNTSSKKWVKI